jgi:hypothetical protein
MADHVEDAVRADRLERRARALEREGLTLAQVQEPRRVVDVGVGQKHRCDRRMAPLAFRSQRGRGENLLAQVDRGVP